MRLVGHDQARAAWRDALDGERMHHAWLLAGKAGLGKMQFALAAARDGRVTHALCALALERALGG